MRLFSAVLSLTFVDVGFDLIGAGTKLRAHLCWHIHRVDIHAEVCLAALELVEGRLLRVDCFVIVFKLSAVFTDPKFVVIGRFIEFKFLEGAAAFLLLMLILAMLFILAIFICRGGLPIGFVLAGSQFAGQYIVNRAHLRLIHRAVYLGLLLVVDGGLCASDVFGRDALLKRIIYFILVKSCCRFCCKRRYRRWQSGCRGAATLRGLIVIQAGFVAVHEDLCFRCLQQANYTILWRGGRAGSASFRLAAR